MRTYGTLRTDFWHDHQSKPLSNEAKLLLIYTLTCSHTTLLGCFRLPVAYIAEDLGWTTETVLIALAETQEAGMLRYDHELQWVWICSFLTWDPIENPNQWKAVKRLFSQVPVESCFFNALVEALKAHSQYASNEDKKALETVSKGFSNQEQDQEQDQEPNIDKTVACKKKSEANEKENACTAHSNKHSSFEKEDVDRVFCHWQDTMGHAKACLDSKRRRLIKNALASGYDVEDLCLAITGCSLTPHNIGQNDRQQRYDGLSVILRDADQIDRFIHNAKHPPKLPVSPDDTCVTADVMIGVE